MKLYHVTRKDIYDDFIKKDGLKPICIKESKIFPRCGEAIFFSEDIDDVVDFATQNFEPDNIKWVILEVDIHDVLDVCKYISRGYIWSSYEVEATSITKNENWYDEFPCVIRPDNIKLIYERV